MTEDLSKLRIKRGQFKSSLTRFQRFLDSLDVDNIDTFKIAQINARLNKIQPLLEEFTECHSEIEQNVPLADLPKESDEIVTFENEFYDAVSRATVIVSEFEEKHKSNNANSIIGAQSQGSQGGQSQQSVQGPSSFSIKLPEIKLPKFSGSYDKWLEFRDAFASMIDNNSHLDALQKFYYLRAHLEGEAARMIESIKVTEQNYDVALSLLKQRYDNNKLIIFNYVKALFEAPPVAKESYADLRNLFDTFTKNLRSLDALGQANDEWSILLIYLISSKFDYRTRRDWEAYKYQGDLPTLQNINDFLSEKCELLEKLENSKGEFNKSQPTQRPYNRGRPFIAANVASNNEKYLCFYCKNHHSIFKCNSFIKLDINRRNKEVKRLQLCLNCLNPSHSVQECPKAPCRRCSRFINSFLHIDGTTNTAGSQHSRPDRGLEEAEDNSGCNREIEGVTKPPQERESAIHQTNHAVEEEIHFASSQSLLGQTNNNKYALLSTADVFILNKENFNTFRARILLDPGSQSNFMTESFCNKAGLTKTKTNIAITGVGNNNSFLTHFKTDVKIQACTGKFSKEISCLILNKITQPMPMCSFDSSFLNIPQGVTLADPEFNVKKDIDILCGVSLFYEILLMNQIKLNKNLILQSTKLGWILAGEINNSLLINTKVFSCLSVEDEINRNLTRFWEVEEFGSVAKIDDSSELHFKENFKRDVDGRFIVEIPFKENKMQLGNSKHNALKCFNYLERRLLKNEVVRQQYRDFMSEYESLGHMSLVTDKIEELSDGDAEAYYLSHHAVIKTTSLTTQLRVVFNGSARTNTGLSLNDVQHTGVTVQNDLYTILLNFRKHTFVLNADISKMYRQVVIDKQDRHFQRIFWRGDSSENLKCYELNVVTYGLASSPFLATRCLLQLSIDNKIDYPLASEVIKNCFYIDDLLVGSDSETELLQLQRDVSKILSGAGFELRKYLSNKPELFKQFDINTSLDASILQLGEHENNKTLGVYWNAHFDTIEYRIQNFSDFSNITKRSILSIIGQIFDILGLLGPVIIRAKVILQGLWKGKFSWDEELLGDIRDKWISFCRDLIHINKIRIPRHVFNQNPTYIELHTFSDSSEAAYGACSYIRCQINSSEFSCRLITAKSKVAPVRPVTLPRLELTAAALACKLAEKVKTSLNINFDRCFYWSDSTITLCWIKGSPERWKKFVSNRVGYIQNKTDVKDWFHVRSQDNPADLISRGIPAESLINNSFWFEGPQWLKSSISSWPKNEVINEEEIPEQKLQVNLVVLPKNDLKLFDTYSTLTKLLRIVALIRRFASNVRCKQSERLLSELEPKEIDDALINLVKMSQAQSFQAEINDLKSKGSVSNSSKLLSLNPFMHNGVMRVGGRIQKANIPFSNKHPIILHNNHKLTTLIFIREHWQLMHCGPQQLLYSVRERFWPLAGRNLARKIVHGCVTCFKVKPKPCNYLMGNLPSQRLNQCSPFLNTGCDYAGYFLLKDRKTRGHKLIKAYVCIFVCMATKAVHLEPVTTLSSEAFLATLRRFIARRGKALSIFSDNGTNFTGANSELKTFLKGNFEFVKGNLANEGVKWQFIPSRAPHFGGLWEAGVKSFKQHLKRVVGNTHLDFEDFTTVLQQIEAVLNSRPLSPLSTSPDDVCPLTPGHFIIGRPLVSLPDPDVTNIKENRLSKYQRLQRMTQHFWNRWYKEYLSELQTRQKWKKMGSSSIQMGDLVIIKDDNLPPLQWKLARVNQLFPGQDGVTRVVSVRFGNGTIAKRALTKVCPLPIDNELSESASASE